MKTQKKIKLKIVKLGMAGMLFGFWTMAAFAQISSDCNFSISLNQTVPDDSYSGVSVTENVTGLNSPIANITITLDIANGYNGDLYGYLRGPNGGFAVLLNRTGVTGSDGFGYSDSGFNVTFNDSANFNNIHFYQEDTYQLNGNGQLTGTWSSDGRAVDPMADPATLASTLPSASLNSFDGTDPNGTWTLFLADLSAGGQSTLLGASLDIQIVPEPSAWAMLGMGLAIFLISRKRASHS